MSNLPQVGAGTVLLNIYIWWVLLFGVICEKKNAKYETVKYSFQNDIIRFKLRYILIVC